MINPGVYRHYKGGIYDVLDVVNDSTNGSSHNWTYVYYRSHATGHAHVRRTLEFNEDVDPVTGICVLPTHPGAVRRFQRVGDLPPPPDAQIVPAESTSIPLLLWCPECGERHIDRGKLAETLHRTHACQACGMLWAPAVVPTIGVQYLPGCKSE